MKKGFLATLLAVAASVAGVTASHATAPTITPLPDVLISDLEDRGATQTNYFVYTNAFLFDTYVTDETADSQLLWSFAEFSEAPDDPQTPTTNAQWFRVNGLDPIGVGDAFVLNEASNPSASVTAGPSGTNNLRAVSPYASFRDIILTPGSGTLANGAYPEPHPTSLALHKQGKKVVFYVSDGQAVSQDEITVKVVEDRGDGLSLAGYVPVVDNKFDGNAGNWYQFSVSAGGTTAYDAANTALRATIPAGNGSALNIRLAGWREAQPGDSQFVTGSTNLKPNNIQPGQLVRAKFHLYASGQSAANANNIPNLRLRVANRFAFAGLMDIQGHDSSDAQIDPMARELTPSTSAANPSVYKVDMKVPTIPYWAANPNEVLYRAFEIIGEAAEAQENGSVSLTESSIGTYPVASLGTATKVYDSDDLDGFGFTAGSPYWVGVVYDRNTITPVSATINGGASGTSLPQTPSSQISATASAANGITFNTTGVDDTQGIGVVAVDWLEGATEDAANGGSARLRLDVGKVYVAKFHATSTQASSNQPQFRFRLRTVKFQYNARTEMGGAKAAGAENNAIATQFLPGVGSQNLDKNGTEAGGNYYVVMPTALDPQIRGANNAAGSIGTVMPLISGQPGPGASSGATPSRRDIMPGFDIIDSLTRVGLGSDNGEKAQINIDRIEIYTINAPAD